MGTKRCLHIVTGASRGLGLGMAQFFVARGDSVVSLSRTKALSISKGQLQTIQVDLSQEFSAERVYTEIFAKFQAHSFAQISLINNAARVDPILPASQLTAENLKCSLYLNLQAPILLTAEFLRQTADYKGQRVVMNISSGVAKNPKASWSVYSASKAGLEAFSQALRDEVAGDPRTRVIVFDPGIMDTEMQAEIRNSQETDFSDLKRFIDFKKNGDLVSAERVGELAARVILGEIGSEAQRVSIAELIALGH